MPFVEYPHRRNRDGTHDSICSRCYATIATETVEDDLARHEHRHLCTHTFPKNPAPLRPPMQQERTKS